MRSIYIACLAMLFTLSVYAEDKVATDIGDPITNFRTYTVHEIPGEYMDKPIHVTMPSYWDHDMRGVRVKAVFKNPESPTGVSAYYLSATVAPRELTVMENADPIMRIELDADHPDILFLHFVFRQKKGTVCTSPD